MPGTKLKMSGRSNFVHCCEIYLFPCLDVVTELLWIDVILVREQLSHNSPVDDYEHEQRQKEQPNVHRDHVNLHKKLGL